MDKEIRNHIQRATQAARRLLEQECAAQLEGIFDILPDGAIKPEPGAHLGDADQITRAKIVAAIEHRRAGGMARAVSVVDYVREAAFTILNRFVALKMLEARGLILESISRGEQSSGFSELGRLAPGLADLPDHGYRLYLECLFDELAREIGVLFDRRDPVSLLWPRRQPLADLLAILNDPSLALVWQEDETIGWVYQYFNTDADRERARYDDNGRPKAPQNSYELAVRNQFFTPRYVVQFLTDNTLGRIWYEMRQARTRFADSLECLVRRPNEVFLAEGAEPPMEASPDGEELSQEERLKKPHFVRFRPKSDPRDLRILDPACGSGHFLIYAFDLLLTVYEEAWADEAPPRSELTGRSLREEYPDLEGLHWALPGLILSHNLHGIEIDPRCAQIAALALWMRAQRAFNDFGISRAERPLIAKTNVVIAEPMPGEQDLLEEFLRELREDRLEGLIREALAVPPDKTVRATKAMADSLADLVRAVWNGMELAGELGSLLKIELLLQDAIAAGREEWEGRLPLFRVYEYSLEGPNNEKRVRFIDGRDNDFWARAEQLTLCALRNYAAKQTSNGRATTRRLFAEDAEQGFALIDLCRKRFDVLLMNPPFGEVTSAGDGYFADHYRNTRLDIFAAFCERLLEMSVPAARIGAITPRDGFFKKTMSGWRELMITRQLDTVVDLGLGVLDSATVRVAAYAFINYESHDRTTFIDLVDLPDRAAALLSTLRTHSRTFVVQSASFRSLPLMRFLYWLPDRLWDIYRHSAPIENDACTPRYGLTTLDDERFCRLAAEIPSESIGPAKSWIFMSKGGDDYPYGGVSNSVVLWRDSAAEMAEVNRQMNGQVAQTRRASRFYFRPAVAFSNRSVFFSVRWHPANYAFSVRGPAIIPLRASQLYILGFFNSRLIRALVQMQTASQTYTSGVLKELRWVQPDERTSERIERAAESAFKIVRGRLCTVETDPCFAGLLVAGEQSPPETVSEYLCWREEFAQRATVELSRVQAAIDEEIAGLYGVAIDDIERCERVDEDVELVIFPPPFAFSLEASSALASYLFGVAMGRWGITFSRKPPSIDATVPSAPPAAASSISHQRGIIVDDEGYVDDLGPAIRSALQKLFPKTSVDESWGELEIALGPGIRDWFCRSFFPFHISSYSGFGRKAPVYWQFSTNRAEYSIWLYYPRLTRDTFFRVLSDYVAPKLQHEERRLSSLLAEAGASPNTTQRRLIAQQELFVEELRAFCDEVTRIAPLWNPNHDDGVIINFAPLWRLVPQHRAWQRECKECWDKLVACEYEWSHLAMHLWPERIVPKCAHDRSLAIAHGLEDRLWVEDLDGRWRPRQSIDGTVRYLEQQLLSKALTQTIRQLEAFSKEHGARRAGPGKTWWEALSDGDHDDHPLALALWPERVLSNARGSRHQKPRHDQAELMMVAFFCDHVGTLSEWSERWAALHAGDLDEEPIARFLYPGRVVERAQRDREFAAMHDLARWFWLDESGGSRRLMEPEQEQAAAVKERESAAVKAALKSLLEAPAANGGNRRGRRRTTR